MAEALDTKIRAVEKQVVKLRNKMKRSDLEYTVQVSASSVDPTKVRWAVQMTPPAEGLAPVTFIKDTPEELIEVLKQATKEIDYTAVERAYHEAQIDACNRTAESHRERIKELDNPTPETEDAPLDPMNLPVEDTDNGNTDSKS